MVTTQSSSTFWQKTKRKTLLYTYSTFKKEAGNNGPERNITNGTILRELIKTPGYCLYVTRSPREMLVRKKNSIYDN